MTSILICYFVIVKEEYFCCCAAFLKNRNYCALTFSTHSKVKKQNLQETNRRYETWLSYGLCLNILFIANLSCINKTNT